MTEQEKGVKPFCELRGHQTEDEAFTAEKQSRWDALSVAAIGEINTRDSPLLRLPAELRMKIYGYVLGHMYIYPWANRTRRRRSPYPPLLVCDCDGARDQRAHGRDTACWPQRLFYYLLCTCRQIHAEAFPVFWSTNTFCFEHSTIMSLVFKNWLPHQKALIRTVRLDINWFVLNVDWKTNLRAVDLASLPSLDQIHIITHSYLADPPVRELYAARNQGRRSKLVKYIHEMLASRPSVTMLIVRDGHFYRRLSSTSRLGKLLKRV